MFYFIFTGQKGLCSSWEISKQQKMGKKIQDDNGYFATLGGLLTTLFFLVSFISPLRAQVLPKEGSKLNYRIIGFSFPEVTQANKYTVEIASGRINSLDSFTKNIVQSVSSKDNRIIAEVPSFGAEYTWRVVYGGKKVNLKSSPFYHFSTAMNLFVDTSKFRLRILQPATEHKDDYVAVDAGSVLYDMKGNPVWSLPLSPGFDGYVADLEFTPEGTITFMYMGVYEINYDGAILWKPLKKGVISGDTLTENYHHQLTKLSNGHYMTLGTEVLLCKTDTVNDSSFVVVSHDKVIPEGFRKAHFGAMIEYDEKGNVVWTWRTSKYLIDLDFEGYMKMDSTLRYDPHDNAFYFDEKNKWIYLGFRNLNRVVKIEYPSGKVLRTYGEIFKPGVRETGKGLFCNQHTIGRTSDGYLYYYNNNSCNLKDSLPTIVMLQEPVSPNDTFKKVWEYTCTVEGNNRKYFFSGGDVIELPDRSLFVNMGSTYSKLFIVNRDKKVLWSALPETFIETDRKWTLLHEDRANIITRKDLERLIWKAEATGNNP